MIIDINMFIGEWPFRRLTHTSAENMLCLMRKAGINIGVVSSLNNVFYETPETGNQLVHSRIKKQKDTFIFFACINPCLPDWSQHLNLCREKLGAKGVKIHPNYHGYRLEDEGPTQLFKRASELNLPILIQKDNLNPLQA